MRILCLLHITVVACLFSHVAIQQSQAQYMTWIAGFFGVFLVLMVFLGNGRSLFGNTPRGVTVVGSDDDATGFALVTTTTTAATTTTTSAG